MRNQDLENEQTNINLDFADEKTLAWYNRFYRKNIFSSLYWAEFINQIGIFSGDSPDKTRSSRISRKKLKRNFKKLYQKMSKTQEFTDLVKRLEKYENNEEMQSELIDEFRKKVMAQACFITGVWCESGGLVTEYEKETVKYLAKGAEFGNVLCMLELGRCYLHGIAAPKSAKEAIKWYAAAAEKGDVRAQFELGKIRESGLGGIQKDFKKAWYWYKRAAEGGYPEAQYKVGVMLEEGRDLLHFREIGLDSHGVDSFRLKVPEVELLLRKEFRYNYSEAVKWYKLAAEQGHPGAMYRLGMCYFNGIGIEQNDFEAFRCFKVASRAGYPDAYYMAGVCIEASRGCHYGRFFSRRRLSEEGYRQAQQNGRNIYADERLFALVRARRRVQGYAGPVYQVTVDRYHESLAADEKKEKVD